MHNYMEKQVFLMTQPKTKCKFDALLSCEAGSLVICQKLIYLKHYLTRQKGANFLHYYVSKQVFS